jgi:hypothetical protein
MSNDRSWCRRARVRAGAAARGPRILGCCVLLLAAGCATLQQVAALRRVAFDIDRVADARLAGVDFTRIRSYDDLTATQIAAIALAITRDELPLSFDLHLLAQNPSDNPAARLLRMDWTLLLDDRETVSGVLDRSYELPPGQTSDIPLNVRLDLLEFFDDDAENLAELVLAVAGAGGEPKRIALRATPTIDTALGPIRYPQPITIVSRQVGN